jgi:tRNA A-37 threonylcarbamoyl transferase component Bud32
MSDYVKTIKYTDRSKDRIDLEIELQKVASKYNFCPKIIDVDYRETECIITMENLNELCLADKYGDKSKHISNEIWIQIFNIISILYEKEGIEYIDITPYNFIEKKGKVYIIDFGDASYVKKDKEINWFLKEFMDGTKEWNPDFE